MAIVNVVNTQNLQQNEIQNARIHVLSGADPSSPVSGQAWYRSDSPYKRFRGHDGSNAFSVPRTDTNATKETVQNEWEFDRGSATPPFSAAATLPSTGSTATMVANLNANYLRGYLESATNTASTIALRDSSGRLQASDPSASADVVNYGFLQGYVSGIRDPKDAARVATTANLSATRVSNVLTANSNASINTAGIDGITTLAINDRVLLKNQSTGADNGIYIITDLGSVSTPWVMQRASDADSSAEVTNGLQIWITAGTTNQQTGWLLTTADPITLNTTALTFIQVNGTSAITQGNGIVISGSTVHAITASAYTQGGIVYASSTAALAMSAALSGVVIGQGTSAPTVITGMTAGTIPKWQASSPYLVNSLISESGSTVTVNGNLLPSGTRALGSLAVPWDTASTRQLFSANGTSGGGQLHWGMYNGSSIRWGIGCIGVESSGNAGSDFAIWQYTDAGGFLGTALTITRSDGHVVIGEDGGNPVGHRLDIHDVNGYQLAVSDASGSFVSLDLQGGRAGISLDDCYLEIQQSQSVSVQISSSSGTDLGGGLSLINSETGLLSSGHGVPLRFYSYALAGGKIEAARVQSVRVGTWMNAANAASKLSFWTVNAGTLTNSWDILNTGEFVSSSSSLGVGTGDTVSARIHSKATTEQLRLDYGGGVYGSFTVGSGSNLTIALTGSGKIAVPSITASRFVTTDAGNLLQGTDLFGGTNTWTGSNTFSSTVIVPTPSSASHAATKAYVDAIGTGLRVKDPVRVATAAALPTNTNTSGVLTASANGSINATGIDGVTSLALNDRVLVKDEATASKNGIFYVSAVGDGSNPWTLTRTTDANDAGELTTGCYTFVQAGTANVNTSWVQENAITTVNTDAVSWNLFYQTAAYSEGVGIDISGLTISIDQAVSPTWTGAHTFKHSSGVSLAPHGASTGNTTEIRFVELVSNGSAYVGFKAPDAITTSTIWTLPAADGAASTYLKTSGAGVLSWAQIASGDISNTTFVTSVSGTSNRITVTGTLTPTIDISSSYVGQATITTLGTVATGTWNATTIATSYGGTGLTAIGSANQVLGVNSGASGLEYKSISGTANQITVTHGTGTITLATPQDIHSAATPTFAGATLSGLTVGSVLFAGTGGVISQSNAQLFWSNADSRLAIGTNSSLASSHLTIQQSQNWAIELRTSSTLYSRLSKTADSLLITTDAVAVSGSDSCGIRLENSKTGTSKLIYGIYAETSGTNTSGTSVGLVGDSYGVASYNIGIQAFATGRANPVGIQVDIGNVSGHSGAILIANENTVSINNAYDTVYFQKNTFTGGANGTAVYGTYNSIVNGSGTLATATAGYFHASGATTNYSIFVNAGTIHIEPLTASTVLQLDASKNVISSNSLPAGTTIAGVGAVRGYAADIGDGSTTTFTLTHNLGTRDIGVFVRVNSGDYEYLGGVVSEATTTNTAKVKFTVAPTTNQYRVVIFGL